MVDQNTERICPKCRHKNPPGALICRRCYHLLVDRDGSDRESTNLLNMPYVTQPGNTASRRVPPGTGILGERYILILDIAEFKKRIPIRLKEKNVLIGRIDKERGIQPDIDLEPFNAIQYGVSRCHAMFQRHNKKAMIVDLNSANGTALNGERVQSGVPTQLRDSDVLHFGRLRAIVYF